MERGEGGEESVCVSVNVGVRARAFERFAPKDCDIGLSSVYVDG